MSIVQLLAKDICTFDLLNIQLRVSNWPEATVALKEILILKRSFVVFVWNASQFSLKIVYASRRLAPARSRSFLCHFLVGFERRICHNFLLLPFLRLPMTDTLSHGDIFFSSSLISYDVWRFQYLLVQRYQIFDLLLLLFRFIRFLSPFLMVLVLPSVAIFLRLLLGRGQRIFQIDSAHCHHFSVGVAFQEGISWWFWSQIDCVVRF